MNDLYGSLVDSLGKYIQSWLLPSVISIGFFTVALLPAVEDKAPWSDIAQMDSTERALLFAFLAVILSFLLASTARELIRLLEGYTSLWPSALKEHWIKKQRQKRRDLRRKISNSNLEEKNRLRERLSQYPRDSKLVLPTRLGNALRAGESYGWIQYGLSTVDLWTHLTAVAEERIVNQLVQARAVLNFFIALIWLSAALSVATLAIALWSSKTLYLLWAIPIIALMPLWYHRAVAAVNWYAQGMQSLADLTRGKLAEALGIWLPGDLEQERLIWRAVSSYAAWGPSWSRSSEWLKIIDEATAPRGAKDEP